MTLITPRTLKPLTSPRQPPTIETPPPPRSHRSRNSTDHAPKVTPAPIEMKLELPNDLTRDSTTMSVISRATTVNEDNIALKLLSEKSMLEEKTAEEVQINSGRTTSNKGRAGDLKPSSRRNQRNITLSVKPLYKTTTPSKSNLTRVNIEFKSAAGVYRRKKVKLVGKRQTSKRVKLSDINLNSVTSGTNKQQPLSKKSMYSFDPVKEFNRPKTQLKLKTPQKANKSEDETKNQTFPTFNGTNIDDGDDNFFMCSNHEEDALEAYNLTDSMIINHVQEKVKDVKSIVDLNEKQQNKETKKKSKTKLPSKWSFVHELERIAKTSFSKKKTQSSETNVLIKAKKEAVIEQKVLTKIYYNYDLKTKSKIKQRKRRNKRTKDLSKTTNFARIPTLIKWVEYTDILQTPAMAMQKEINKSNLAKNGEKSSEMEIANQKYTL